MFKVMLLWPPASTEIDRHPFQTYQAILLTYPSKVVILLYISMHILHYTSNLYVLFFACLLKLITSKL